MMSVDLVDRGFNLVFSTEGNIPIKVQRTGSSGWLVRMPAGQKTIRTVSLVGCANNAKNLPGRNTGTLRDLSYHNLVVGDAVAYLDSCSPGAGRKGYMNDFPGRSSVSAATAIVVVPSEFPIEVPCFRGPAIGDADTPIVKFLRTRPIRRDSLKMELLPSVIDIASLPEPVWPRGKPGFEYLTNIFSRFNGELYAGWDTDTRTPDSQHPGYGSYLTMLVSLGYLYLCSTASIEEKRPLAEAMVQWGLDLAGAFGDGRVQIANNGHAAGRKALVMLAGFLTEGRGSPLANPSVFIPGAFQEDQVYVPQVWWTGEWKVGYAPGNNADPSVVASPPGPAWGNPNDGMHRGYAWALKGYLPHVVGAQVGTAVGMSLMGLEEQWSRFACDFVRQWMHGAGTQIERGLDDFGLYFDFGRDYTEVCGGGLCAAAHLKYLR